MSEEAQIEILGHLLQNPPPPFEQTTMFKEIITKALNIRKFHHYVMQIFQE